MVHTLPDYTTKYRMAKIFGQIDSGELAGRLGALSVFDRRGYLVWCDDFQDNIEKWAYASNGTGASVALSTASALWGASSCALTCGSDGARMATISKYISNIPNGKLGVEVALSIGQNIDWIAIRIQRYDGTNDHKGIIKLDVANDELEYWDGNTSAYVKDRDFTYYHLAQHYHNIKFVVDPSTDKYVRCLVDDNEYDWSAYDLDVTLNATAPSTAIGVNAYGTPGNNPICYVGAYIVTRNEP